MSLEPEFAERVAGAAYQAAFDFFQPPPDWEMEELEAVPLEGDASAQIWARPDYLYAKIVYDPSKHASGSHLWGSIGHEVAHLLLAEYMAVEDNLSGFQARMLLHAGERAVTRLTRLFLRQHPYPGDEQFEFEGGDA